MLLRWRGLLILSLLAPGCVRAARPLPPAPPRQPLLAVVTWNMHADAGDLPRLLSDLSSGRLTGASGQDYLVLLQEAADERVRALTGRGRPPLATFFAPVRRGPRRTTGNAMVSTRPLSDARVIDLPRERQPRAAAAALVEVGGERLFVVSAHLENRLGWLRGLFGDRARRRQVDALLSALPRGAHGIVGGDMNTMLGPGEPALDALFERFGDTPRGDPQPTFGDRLRLDHLFFDLPAGWSVSQRVLDDRYGSDHHPVLAVIGTAP